MEDSRFLASDSQIVAEVLAGRRSRFAEIVERYEVSLRRMAYSRLGDWEAADEVVQETFLCVLKSLASYDSKFSFRTWLWTILMNQCRRQFSHRARRPRVSCWSDHQQSSTPVASPDPIGRDPQPLGALLAKERSERLNQLLSRLPPRQANALRLRFFGDLKFREIADTMQCSLSAAKVRVRLGLVALSRMIRDETNRRPTRPDERSGLEE